MDISQILEELSYDTGELPREAIEAAIVQQREVIPHLLCLLENAVNQISEVISQDNYQGHLYAMYLLAQFREQRAYPLILQLVSFSGEIPHAIVGDMLTEDLGRILASTCGDDIHSLQKIIEDTRLSEYVRTASLSALVTLVGAQLKSRDQIVGYFHTLFGKLQRSPLFVWDHLVLSAIELYPEELFDLIMAVFEDKLVNLQLVSIEDVQTALKNGKELTLNKLYDNTELIEDAVMEMEKWYSPAGNFS